MKAIVRGNLIDINGILSIGEIIGFNYNLTLDDKYFLIAENPSFTIKFLSGGVLYLSDSWVKKTVNGRIYEGVLYGKFLTETELPKWVESYEKLKKTRDTLVDLWLEGQKLPIIT
jgi:hypothetical protein